MTGFKASMSNFAGGFKGGLTVRGMPLAVTHPGKVFFVSDSGLAAFPNRKTPSNNNDGSFNAPFATIEYAMSQCLASRGDVIFVMPGHTETVTTDGGLALDVAGVAVIGLGTGTLRPLILLDAAAAAAVTVTAANITLQNFELRASFADITNAIDVTAAWFAIDNCEFTEEGAALNFLDYINASGADNSANGLSVTNCVGTAIDEGQNSFLAIVNNLDRLVFSNNLYVSDHANTLSMINCTAGAILTDIFVTWNFSSSLTASGDLFITNDVATNTGIVAHNRVGHADVTGAHLLSSGSGSQAAGWRWFDNLSTSVDTLSGFLLPDVDVDL